MATERELFGETTVEVADETQEAVFKHVARLARHYNVSAISVYHCEEGLPERAVVTYA